MSNNGVTEKLGVLIHHWISHNEEHAQEYRKWAERLETEGFAGIVNVIRQAAQLVLASNRHFFSAREKLDEVK